MGEPSWSHLWISRYRWLLIISWQSPFDDCNFPFGLSVSGLNVAGSVSHTVAELVGRPGEMMPGPEHMEAAQRGEDFVVADITIRGPRGGTRFLLSFRCGMVWGRGGAASDVT